MMRSAAGTRTGFTALALSLGLLTAAPVHGQEAPEELDRFEEECGEAEPAHAEEEHADESRYSDECIPLAVIPERPRPLLEIGEPFLATGTLHKGIKLPGGAVWQPAFLAFGRMRMALQGGNFQGGDAQLAEAPARLDLFGNLYLTQTERVVVGMRPLDRDGRFTGFTFQSPDDGAGGSADDESSNFDSELNGRVSTLFFEGDFAELFPAFDRDDSGSLDIYFSVGRQPIAFGDGLLMNEDILDMVGLTRANMQLGSIVNTRVTGIFGWGDVTRHGGVGNVEDEDSRLFGLFSELDLPSTTLQLEGVFVSGSEQAGDGLYGAVADIRRIAGRFNSTFRVVGSLPVGDETSFNRPGVVVHEQFSWTPHHSHNFWYVSAFAGIGRFRSAARGPAFGGPLGATGVLFAAPGIGRLGGLLGSTADHSVGGAIGHQLFFGHTRQQLIVEAGGRIRTRQEVDGSPVIGGDRVAAGARFQSAAGRRFVILAEAGTSYDIDAALIDMVARLQVLLKL